ncbi:STAS domain-containing protein [Stenotrophomonas acidaminiphila]|uniref:STAS domain-containing protein n=1 Tax=Stenotrophomonas acidaminiphila TaxID=128780 RepID=UPI002896A4DB|nr:STAS domain-containing protein [Stenotrophomonas acidaminiphila]
MASDATARVEGDALYLAGTLDRAAAVALWPQLLRQVGGLRRLDLNAVERVDSAGVALLAELSARMRSNGGATIVGAPVGLDELRAAYRLSPDLDFNASSAEH